MDTPASPLESPAEGSTRDALRELRDRAQSTLEKQRSRMREIDEQLTGKLDAAAEQLTEAIDNESEARVEASLLVARQTLDQERNDWQAERDEAESDLNRQREELSQQSQSVAETEQAQAERAAELSASEQQLAEQQNKLEDERQQIEQARAELETARANWQTDQQSADSSSAELQSELTSLREQLASQQSEQEQQQRDANEQSDRVVTLEAELATHRQQAEELQQREQALAAERDELQTKATGQDDEIDRLRGELETVELTLDAVRQSQQESQSEAESQLSQRIVELEQQLTEQAEKYEADQELLEQQLSQALALGEELEAAAAASSQTAVQEHEAARGAWNAERESLLSEHDRLAEMLERVTQKLAETESNSEPLEELRNKFELALADVRTLREQNSELEQELARRPEHNDEESVELIALREQRDSLAAEVEQLRNQPPPPPPAADSGELADLQRRFEMAVEDVRELRVENEKLEQQLANSSQTAASGSEPGEAKWEELKRKLLLSLEEESDEVSPERREERASIEHTIRITDDVVAAKDREIHELRQQLEEIQIAGESIRSMPDVPQAEGHASAVDADAAVKEARDRLAVLEAELTEKLRTAELELSVERAKIAREQTQLAEWRIELETMRDSMPNNGSSSKKGGGRWFSKLGLGGDEG